MHGHGKNAKGYRDTWIEHADRYEFMVVAPLFDPEQWGGGGYSYGSVIGRDGRLQDASMWSFSVIEHLFDAIKGATGNQSAKYFIYGHSEGGQFVHRLVLLLPDARYARAVAANPGWYTMPRFDIKFPYGLGGSPATEGSLKKSLGREFVLMLGDRDTDPNHKDLRKTPQAMVQGAYRFERGQNYLQRSPAPRHGTEVHVRLETPGCAGSGAPEQQDVQARGSGSHGALILQVWLSQPFNLLSFRGILGLAKRTYICHEPHHRSPPEIAV